MIISHKHKFIFIKTRKTAGTSIEIFLSQFCGSKDIITPINFKDEKIRSDLNCKPQNYYLPIKNYSVKNFASLILRQKKPKYFWNHMSAQQIKERVGHKIWNSYYKFCFERNPWDKTVSSYFHYKKTQKESSQISFEEYLENLPQLNFPQFNFPLYTDSKKNLLVDFIGKFENLTNDMKKICHKFGIQFDKLNIRAKGNYRTANQHYSTFYNTTQQEFIRKKFEREIKLMEYKFDRI